MDSAKGFAVSDAQQSFDNSVRESYKLGFEYVPNISDVRYYRKRIAYRAGAYFNNEYYTVAGRPVNSAGITLGATLPVFRWYNGLSISLDMGQRGPFKGELVRENYCDGFGDCLPGCPTGAITFETREAPEYDEEAVKKSKEKQAKDKAMNETHVHPVGGCPGSQMMRFDRKEETVSAVQPAASVSRLNQWPCQIKLVPAQAPFFNGAKLLIAADCTAYAYARMHEDFMKGKITLIGCPKLDDVDYSEKLTAIIRDNDIKAVTIVRMEVPCCGGLQRAAETALKNSGKFIPWQVVTISRDGNVLE